MILTGFRCDWTNMLAGDSPTGFALDQKPDFRFLANISQR
jgi:hypothetical protein